MCVYLSHAYSFSFPWPVDPDGSGVVPHDSMYELKSTKGDHCKSTYSMHTSFASTLMQVVACTLYSTLMRQRITWMACHVS